MSSDAPPPRGLSLGAIYGRSSSFQYLDDDVGCALVRRLREAARPVGMDHMREVRRGAIAAAAITSSGSC